MISVIVPVYNCIGTLDRCVRAICGQTIANWELLLIDDGSTDGSGQRCDQLAADDRRIRVFHKTNGGVSSARNLGLDNAQGEYVMFCDSDDWVEAGWCEKLLEKAQESPDSLPVCNYFRSSVSDETINYSAQCNNLESIIPKADFFSLNRQELLGIPWNKIYCRKVVEQSHIRFQPGLSLGEDLVFVLDYLHLQVGGIVFVNEPLYHYSVGNSGSLSVKYYPDLANIYRILYARIKQELCSIAGAWEKWEKDYQRSYFYAFERVFRNTLSAKNLASTLKKHSYNAYIFKSDEFQDCRRIVLSDHMNVLQKAGLKTNWYLLFWAAVVTSEAVSTLCHHK